MGKQLSDVVENIVGKGEIARYEQFLPFPQYFQKLSVVDVSKWSKGLKLVIVAFPLGAHDYGNSTKTGPPVSG